MFYIWLELIGDESIVPAARCKLIEIRCINKIITKMPLRQSRVLSRICDVAATWLPVASVVTAP